MSGPLDLDLNLDLDLDLNLNLNLAGRGGSGGGVRYNTEDYPKLAPIPPSVFWPQAPYKEFWKPEYRAWAYLYDFVVNGFPGQDPIDVFKTELQGQTIFPVPGTSLTAARLNDQVQGVLDASIDRSDRAREIISQASGAGAIGYWAGLLRIDPSRDTNTILLIMVAHKIGEFVAMGLKGALKMRRPSQVYPWIMPLIDPPDHPSYPSSHSLQGHLITAVLKFALRTPIDPPATQPGVPSIGVFLKSAQEFEQAATDAIGRTAGSAQGINAINGGAWNPDGASLGAPYPQTARALDVLADRVARNREVAGVHYNMDSLAGAYVALLCMQKIKARYLAGVPALAPSRLFYELFTAARTELYYLP